MYRYDSKLQDSTHLIGKILSINGNMNRHKNSQYDRKGCKSMKTAQTDKFDGALVAVK